MLVEQLNKILDNIGSYSNNDDIVSDVILVFHLLDTYRFDVAQCVFEDHSDIKKLLMIAEIKPKIEKYYKKIKEQAIDYEDFSFLYEHYIQRNDIFVDITEEIFGDDFKDFESAFFSYIKSFLLDSWKDQNKPYDSQRSLMDIYIESKLDEYKNSRYLSKIKSIIEEIKEEI